jgi:CubicO group peptidase (beta-lactamase class C family)
LLVVLVGMLILSAMPAKAQTPTPTAEPPIVPVATPGGAMAPPAPDLTTVTPLPLEGERRRQFEHFVTDAQARCEIPGAAVVVVQNGEIVFREGFGVREHGRLAPVTADTLFRIGSITKSVTATLAAALVDEGQVAWETPVVDLLPAFALSDPALTARITLADLFSAATGLPRRDLELVLEADAFTPEGLLAAVASYPLTAPLGERYQYSNQAFAVGGYAAAVAAGAAPGELREGYRLAVQHQLLDPIGMDGATFELEEVLESGDYAAPHFPELTGTPRTISLLTEDRFVNAVAPAGALWANATDMGRYLQMLLGRGVAADGTRVVSEENLQRTWQPGVAMLDDPTLPPLIESGLGSYGLGWNVGEYGGLTLLSHDGGSYGFAAQIAFLPEADLGIAVLTNDVVCGAFLALAAPYRLFELVFDRQPEVAALFDDIVKLIATERAAALAALAPVDPAVVEPLLGWYEHPALGRIALTLRDGELLFDAGEVRSRLQVLQGDADAPERYVAVDPPLSGGRAWITFEPGEDDQPRPVLTVQVEVDEDPLVYPFEPVAGDTADAASSPEE